MSREAPFNKSVSLHSEQAKDEVKDGQFFLQEREIISFGNIAEVNFAQYLMFTWSCLVLEFL